MRSDSMVSTTELSTHLPRTQQNNTHYLATLRNARIMETTSSFRQFVGIEMSTSRILFGLLALVSLSSAARKVPTFLIASAILSHYFGASITPHEFHFILFLDSRLF
eukprot:GDKK01030926.1.p1 GENE.GDKK01030926.1~~GDKK01030926.1.p1  ORF type:complete len:107 (-),score=5.42 GDKK01030926.1:478-798(-)